MLVTNIGLITSDGPYGPDIMPAEWTHHISYAPSLIAVHIGKKHATHSNIVESKEFGVNICSSAQNIVASIAGKESGKNVNKIKVLKEFEVEFYKAKKINVLMVKKAVINVECKLFKVIDLGDHTMFVGEVIEISANNRTPLLYHDGKYWTLGEQIKKPSQEVLDRIDRLFEKYRK